jgi:DNA-binding IscR family transcriptional regulator
MYTSIRSNNAIRIVVDILRHREWTSVLDIAQRIELPVIYTRILLIPLVKSTIIKKNSGKYKLGKITDMFTLKDIIRAVA